jgi:hypothetical protein
MNCPPEVAGILLEIIQTGLLRIRQLGWAHAPERCAVEADHLHNLPELLRNYSPALLTYYWEAERTAFVSQSAPADLTEFEPLWERLDRHLSNPTDRVLAH